MCTVDLYNVFRFPIMYFRDSPIVAQIFIFKSEVESKSSLKTMEMQLNHYTFAFHGP